MTPLIVHVSEDYHTSRVKFHDSQGQGAHLKATLVVEAGPIPTAHLKVMA